MRYLLLHLTTFLPICAKVIIAPWGLKMSWLLYLFFTYILLEHKKFNGYSVSVFANLQRQAECCMILSLFLASWVSPTVCALPFVCLVWGKGIEVDMIFFSLFFSMLYSFDVFQIGMVTLSIMTILLDTEPTPSDVDGWHRACIRRIMFRGVQVMSLMMVYETMYVRMLILFSSVVLKGVVYLYTLPDAPDSVRTVLGDPVNFLQSRSHSL
jgi:hypothetical protein